MLDLIERPLRRDPELCRARPRKCRDRQPQARRGRTHRVALLGLRAAPEAMAAAHPTRARFVLPTLAGKCGFATGRRRVEIQPVELVVRGRRGGRAGTSAGTPLLRAD